MISLKVLFGDDATVLRETNFQLLLIAGVIGPLGTALLSPILDSLIEPFGVSPADIGLLMSAFIAPIAVMIPVAGVLSDRLGRKPVLVTGLLVFGLAGTSVLLTTDFRIALALRFVQGLGFAGLTPVIVTSIGDLYDGDAEATAQGLRFAGSGLTQTVFTLLAGLLVVTAWQYPFLLYALSVPIAVLVHFWLDEPSIAATEPTHSTDGGDAAHTHLRGLLDLLSHRRVQALIVAQSATSAIWICFLTYNSLIVVRLLDGTPAQAGLFAALGSLSFGITATQAGQITSLLDSRLYPLLSACVGMGIGLIAMLFATSVGIAAVGVVLLGGGIGVSGSLFRSIITGFAPASLRGSLVSVDEAFSWLIGALIPIAIGGVISIAAPSIGLEPALQIAGAGTAVLGASVGVVCLLLARTAPQVQAKSVHQG